MSRCRLLLPLILLALWPPASASAAPVATVKLVECDAAAGTAGFDAAMRLVAGAARMQMRFTLLARDGGWERVAAPTFDSWTSSAPGKTAYVYSKRLVELTPGAYRVDVRFRWRAADGTVVRTATRRSKACVVPDERPDLVPVRVRVSRGPTPDSSRYTVVVANRGTSPAGPFPVALSVDGLPLSDQALDGLDARQRASVVFTGPPCEDVLVATVDAEGLVDEAEEADDTLTLDCDDL